MEIKQEGLDPQWKRIMSQFHEGATAFAEEALREWNTRNPLPDNEIRLKKKYLNK